MDLTSPQGPKKNRNPGPFSGPRLAATAVALSLSFGLIATGCSFTGGGIKQISGAPEGMVLVPAGPFTMGTDDDDESVAEELGLPYTLVSDATPARTVELPAFYIDRHELTNAQYLQFLDATELPVGPPYGWSAERRPPEGTNDLPVTGINWYEAQFACLYFGKRLPSEAEWEKAARGTDGNLFPWGNTYDESKANVAAGKPGRLAPVGSHPQGASVYGVQDMAGNAWEWTRSWYAPYPGSEFESDNYGKRFKVLRGNSHAAPGHYPVEQLRKVVGAMSSTTYRFSLTPTGKSPDSGVRCSRDANLTP